MASSTRSRRNDEVGREWCSTVADILARCTSEEGEAEIAIRQAEEWLRAIADGADPSQTIFRGEPHKSDRYSLTIARVVQARINAGMTQGMAIRSVAEWEAVKSSRVKNIYLRHRHEIDQDDPLDCR